MPNSVFNISARQGTPVQERKKEELVSLSFNMTSYSRRSRDYSRSRYRSPSYESDRRSYSRSRSRSRSDDSIDVENPGNNLYVTGLSPRITRRELVKHFSSEGGKVVDVHLVMDPWTRESRGFGFVTMSTVKEADRCIKYLDRSVLQGRVITVEKAKRRRGRTPTPVRRRSPSYSPYSRRDSRSPSYSSDERGRGRSYSPYYVRAKYHSRSRSPYSRSPVRSRERSYSPCYRSRSRYDRSLSPRYQSSRGRDRSYSPYYRRRDRSYSHRYRGRDRSYSPLYRGRGRDRSDSPSDRRRSRYSPASRSVSPRDRSNSRRRRIDPDYYSESLSRSSGASSVPRSGESRSPTPSY